MRKIALSAVAAMLVGLVALPAGATRPDPNSDLEEGHKIWICHATRSLENPYVKILIDIAAWDVEDPDSNDHGPIHHAREKDGVEWTDYALESPEDECELPDEPEPEVCPAPSRAEVDYVILFEDLDASSEKLTDENTSIVSSSLSSSIPAGTYDVILGTGDAGRGLPLTQNNEQWYLDGDTPSGFTTDLEDVGEPIGPFAENVGTVTFDSAQTTATAKHWSAIDGNVSQSADSVIPLFACLTDAN